MVDRGYVALLIKSEDYQDGDIYYMREEEEEVGRIGVRADSAFVINLVRVGGIRQGDG